MTEKYHLRRPEKAIADFDEIGEIIRQQKFMTLALCRQNEPYLVTLNYGYHQEANCFFFHCAKAGKKLDFLRANPRVWGQILEDLGYIQGECSHAYRCVEFEGVVDFPDSLEEKKNALELMIDQIEPQPQPLKERMLTEDRISGVTIGRIHIEGISAKKNKSTS